MSELTHQIHTFSPIYNEDSRILILGSFPSVKSREQGFYYGHPQNRFWKVLSNIYNEELPCTIKEKKIFMATKLLVIDDNENICDLLRMYLEKEGFKEKAVILCHIKAKSFFSYHKPGGGVTLCHGKHILVGNYIYKEKHKGRGKHIECSARDGLVCTEINRGEG